MIYSNSVHKRRQL